MNAQPADDKQAILSIVNEMATSMTGAQSTRHWAPDALWFDIPAFASKGIEPARKMFDNVFGNFTSCKVDILETDVVLNGDIGIVCTVQRTDIEFKNGDTRTVLSRVTDCFEKRDDEWQLIHEHASVPAGGDWNGKFVTA